MGNKQTIFTDEQLDAYQVSLHARTCLYPIWVKVKKLCLLIIARLHLASIQEVELILNTIVLQVLDCYITHHILLISFFVFYVINIEKYSF